MSCPEIILLILLVNFQCDLTLCEVYTFEPPNLKTVLFKETDLMTRCWSTHEVNLLLNRRVMQDLIPRKIPRDFPLLLKYLQNLESLAKQIPRGLNQSLVMAAMGDVMGGYLSAIVLPIANEAYYAGNADYQTVNELHMMLDRWKWYLSTDGGTWSQQCDMRKIPTKVTALDLDLKDPPGACKELYVNPPNNNVSENIGSETVMTDTSRVAIPYFDNNMAPNAIALPFRSRNLYSLMDPNAAYILVKYYTLVMRCLSPSPKDVLAFSNFFHVWIVSKVVPHLHDQDKWYPALGGVMRVVETIRQKGLAPANTVFVAPLSDDHMDAALGANIEEVGGADESLKHAGVMGSYFHLYNNPYAIVVLMILFLIAFLLLCCCCMCLWLLCRPKKKMHILFDSDENTLKDFVVSFYCNLKNALKDSLGSDSSIPSQSEKKKSSGTSGDTPKVTLQPSMPEDQRRSSGAPNDQPKVTLSPYLPINPYPKMDDTDNTDITSQASGSSSSDEDVYSSSSATDHEGIK